MNKSIHLGLDLGMWTLPEYPLSFLKKKNSNGRLKKTEIFKTANSQKNSQKFQGLVFGLVG